MKLGLRCSACHSVVAIFTEKHREAARQRWQVRACQHASRPWTAASRIAGTPVSKLFWVAAASLSIAEGLRASRPAANHVLHCSLQLPAELEKSARFRAERQAAEAQAAAERVHAAVGATQAVM